MASLDLIIPLGNGSRSNDDELKLCLRSLDRNTQGIGRVILATKHIPEWIQNVTIVPMGDPLKHNKDGNLINKVVMALINLDIRGDFLLCADDNVFNLPLNLEDIPMICNGRGLNHFSANSDEKWFRRMRRTLEFVKSRGMPVDYNYDSHTPQKFNATKVLRGLGGIDYASDIGYCIYTLFRCVSGETGGVHQNEYKTTHESEGSVNSSMDRMFVGYNDEAFLHGLRERLFEKYPDKSRYEK